MIDIKKVSQNFFSQKKNIIILVLIVVLILVGVFFYFKYKNVVNLTTEEEQVHEMLNNAAEDASKLKITEEDRSFDLQNSIKNNPGKVLPDKEAKTREAEIIKSMYQ